MWRSVPTKPDVALPRQPGGGVAGRFARCRADRPTGARHDTRCHRRQRAGDAGRHRRQHRHAACHACPGISRTRPAERPRHPDQPPLRRRYAARLCEHSAGPRSRRRRHTLRPWQPALRNPALDRRRGPGHQQCVPDVHVPASDIVTTIAPSLEAAIATTRLYGTLRYTPAVRLYATYSSQDGVDQVGDGRLLAALVPGLFYVDVRGAASVLPTFGRLHPGQRADSSPGATPCKPTPRRSRLFWCTVSEARRRCRPAILSSIPRRTCGSFTQSNSAQLRSENYMAQSRLCGGAQRRGFRSAGAAGACRRHQVRRQRHL